MVGYLGTPDFDHQGAPVVGVLVVNLGTPEAPTPAAVRRYLAEFLWDPRVVELPRALWWLILHGVILRVRPRRTAEAYAKVWRPDGAPLLALSRALTGALGAELEYRRPGRLRTVLAMRYGTPSIAHALGELREAGAERLLVLPLYPQYSASTTASVFDAVSAELSRWRWVPELRFITAYEDEPAYIDALCERIRAHWSEHGRGDRLLLSFHGIPQHYFDAGDPYPCQCRKTARLVRERLDLGEDAVHLAFQSRFGPREWVRPYTDEVLREWARSGVKRVDVACPGFAVDCLETLEEIAMRGREQFLEHGGERLDYIPALNDHPAHVRALAELLERHLEGWLDPGRQRDPQRTAHLATETGARR